MINTSYLQVIDINNIYYYLFEGKKMRKALIIYCSQRGTTKKFAEEIGKFLEKDTIETNILSIYKCSMDDIKNADYIFLGCWTSGLMIILQHPEKIWVEFANKITDFHGKKIALFTTYKLATGSMFKNMKKHIKNGNIELELKSRNGLLSEMNKTDIQKYINN
jgi:flavodoxin